MEELQHLLRQKDVQEALFLASPDLLKECVKWQNIKLFDQKDEQKLIFSLLKYALRMHNRCTPYGLFAACGVFSLYAENISVNQTEYTRSTRLDMDYTCALAQNLAKKDFILPYLKFYPNTTEYTLLDKVRYIEYQYKNKRRIHQISAVDSSIYLQKILKKSQNGATLAQLVECISNEEISLTDAQNFIIEIIDSQILISELEPSVTGGESLSQMLSVLTSIGTVNPDEELLSIIESLSDILSNLRHIDITIGNDISIYKHIIEQLKSINIPFDINKLFQTDLFINSKEEENKIDSFKNDISDSLLKAIKVLNKLSFPHDNPELKSFKDKFYQRYEDKEVLLSEALDNESGIGYGANSSESVDVSPLIEELMVENVAYNKLEISYHNQQSYLLRKLITAYQNKQKIIYIKEEELVDINEKWDDLPDSMSVMYCHLGKLQNTLYLRNVGGSSAINLIGRFGLGDNNIKMIIEEIAQDEQAHNPDKILASILHLPENRTGNILLRPIIRKYEIPYLSKSLLPQEQQLHVRDITISIKEDKIILYSKRLGKEIIPRLDNAHNYSFNALPVYQFLCDMQTQGLRDGLFFDWGSLKNDFSYFPRVEVENVIISLATWQLSKQQYKDLLQKDSISKNIQLWQEKWEIPDLILLTDGDNELLINLKDKLSLSMFIDEIQKRENITLREFLFEKESAFVNDEKGNAYSNEFIAILNRKSNKIAPTNNTLKKVITEKYEISSNNNLYTKELVSRSFPIGSEWLYYKIYCGIKTSDRILTEIIRPLAEYLIKIKLIDSWFFVRYADPDIHIRLRFHFSDLKNIALVIERFHKAVTPFHKGGLIWKIQTDTYEREIERYGQSNIILSEQIFYYDSMCIVNFLDKLKDQNKEDIRWLFGIKSVDKLLDIFKLNLDQKLILMEKLKISFAEEFNMNKNIKLQIDKKYRAERINVENFLDDDFLKKEYPFAMELLEKRDNQLIYIVDEMKKFHNDEFYVLLYQMIPNYIHMHLNRLFKNKQRLHEMVIYNFMWRTYRSKMAKVN